MSPDDVAALRLEEITRGIRDLRIDTRAQIDTLVSRVGALEGLASPANGPIGAAAAGSSTAPSTSTAGSDAAMAALSARIRDLEAGLASARTDLASVRTELSGTQLSLGVAEQRLERSESRVRLLAGHATENEEGIRAVAELMGQWAGRQLNREEVCTFFHFSLGHQTSDIDTHRSPKPSRRCWRRTMTPSSD